MSGAMAALGAFVAVICIIAEVIAMFNLGKILNFFWFLKVSERAPTDFTPMIVFKTVFVIFIPLFAFIFLVFYVALHV